MLPVFAKRWKFFNKKDVLSLKKQMNEENNLIYYFL